MSCGKGKGEIEHTKEGDTSSWRGRQHQHGRGRVCSKTTKSSVRGVLRVYHGRWPRKTNVRAWARVCTVERVYERRRVVRKDNPAFQPEQPECSVGRLSCRWKPEPISWLGLKKKEPVPPPPPTPRLMWYSLLFGRLSQTL